MDDPQSFLNTLSSLPLYPLTQSPTPDGADRTARPPLLLFRSAFTLAALLRSETRKLSVELFQLPPRSPAPILPVSRPFLKSNQITRSNSQRAYKQATHIFSRTNLRAGRTTSRVKYRQFGRRTVIRPLQSYRLKSLNSFVNIH